MTRHKPQLFAEGLKWEGILSFIPAELRKIVSEPTSLQIWEGTENPNSKNLNFGKTASLFSKEKMNPQSRSCHSRRNMCHGNSRGKMCHGKILTDSAQDANMQIETKLNAIEQDNTYPSNEENSQHTCKKRWSLNSRGGLRMSKQSLVTKF